MSKRMQRLGLAMMLILGAWLAMTVAAGAASGDPGTISGTVSEVDGTKVEGATVTAYDLDGNWVDSTQTLANGTYELNGTTDGETLPPGSYVIGFSTSQPWRTQYSGGVLNQEDATPVLLGSGGGLIGVNAVWTGITGTLSDPEGLPIEMASVSAYDAAIDTFEGYVANASTAADGSYTLWVPPGAYTVQFSHFGDGNGGQFWFGNVQDQADAAAVTVTGTALAPASAQFTSISGTITGPDGPRDGYVEVFAAGEGFDQSFTQANATGGAYEVWVPAGAYKVRFTDSGHEDATYAMQYYPGTRNQADATNVSTVTDPTATANATWYTLGGAVTWIDGTPDTKAYIELLEPNLSPPNEDGDRYEVQIDSREATTGAYQFLVAPGQYKLRVYHDDVVTDLYANQYYGGAGKFADASVVTVSTANVTNANVRFVAIKGAVRRAGDDTGVADVFVEALEPGANLEQSVAWGTTDTSGNYTLVVPPGSYEVMAGLDGGNRWRTDTGAGALNRVDADAVTVQSTGNATGQDIEVESIRGTVNVPGTLDDSGLVAFYPPGDNPEDLYYSAPINLDGTFEVFAPPGTYVGDYWVYTTDGGQGFAYTGGKSTLGTATSLILGAGQTLSGQNLTFRSVTGQLSTAGTNLVNGGYISAWRAELPNPNFQFGHHETYADATGAYKLLVPAGQYKLRLTASREVGVTEFGSATLYHGANQTLDTAIPLDVTTSRTGINGAFDSIKGTLETAEPGSTLQTVDAFNPLMPEESDEGFYGWTYSENTTGNYTLLVPAGVNPALQYSVTFGGDTTGRGSTWAYSGATGPVAARESATTVPAGTTGLTAQFYKVSGSILNNDGTPVSTSNGVDFYRSGLDSVGGGDLVAYASPNTAGAYRAYVPADTYKAEFWRWTGTTYESRWFNAKASYTSATPIAIGASNQPTNISMQFTAPGTITGTAFIQGTTTKLGGICVGAFDGISQVATATTAVSGPELGTYSMSVPPGSYKVRFIDCTRYEYKDEWHNNVATEGSATPVVVTSGTPTPNINATLETGFVPEPPKVGPITTATGTSTIDPRTGETQITMQNSAKSDITLSVPITCPDGTSLNVPSVRLVLNGVTQFTSLSSASPFSFTIPQAQVANGTLTTAYTCSGNPATVTIGKIQLFDPSGFVTDAVTDQKIIGATVYLYEVPTWTPWTNADVAKTATQCETITTRGAGWDQPAPTQLGVLADPESGRQDPEGSMQLTNSNGRYGWDVAQGCWYVVVSKAGYETKVSPVVGVPPEVTDLDIELTPLPDTTAPAKVGTLKALPVAGGTSPDTNIAKKAKVNFTKPTDADLAGFELKVKTGTTTVKTLTLAKTVTLPYTVTGLAQGKTYSFSVQAFDNAAAKNYSTVSTVTLNGTVLTAAAPGSVVKGKSAVISGKLTKVGNIALAGKAVQLQVRTLISGTKYTAWANSGTPTTTSKLAATKGTYKFTRTVSKKSQFRVLYGPSSGTELGSISPTKTVGLK